MSTSHKKHTEPLLRVVKFEGMSRSRRWLVRLIAVAASLVVSGILIVLLAGINPLKVYATMFRASFGSGRLTWNLLRDSSTLLLLGVALAPAFAMKFWNIGAEGQMLVGAITTAFCMKYFTGMPTVLLILVMIVASIVAGAFWGLLPGVFKAFWNTNETLFTLMMNYIAIQFTSFMVAQWEIGVGNNTVGVINSDGHEGWLPGLFTSAYNKDYGINILIVLTVTVLMFIYLKYSKHGYEISVVGDSVNTARYAGINVKKVYIRTMLLSGAVCGLAGFLAVSGVSHSISTSTAGGRGFTAIIVAWLAKFNTFSMIAIAVLLCFLDQGALEIASSCNVNTYVAKIITGVILFFLLAGEFFTTYRIKVRGHH